jgi:hypothetical protein
MAAFNKLSDAFDKGKDRAKDSKTAGLDAVKQSLAIVKAVDRMKLQGIKVTKKADFDYLLALRVLERAGVDYEPDPAAAAAPLPPEPPKQEPPKQEPPAPQKIIKRNPNDHPKEFQKAMELSKNTIAQVEQMMQTGQPIPVEKMEEYELCKKFLAKFNQGE